MMFPLKVRIKMNLYKVVEPDMRKSSTIISLSGDKYT